MLKMVCANCQIQANACIFFCTTAWVTFRGVELIS